MYEHLVAGVYSHKEYSVIIVQERKRAYLFLGLQSILVLGLATVLEMRRAGAAMSLERTRTSVLLASISSFVEATDRPAVILTSSPSFERVR